MYLIQTQGTLAIIVTCILYSIIANGQIVDYGTVQCDDTDPNQNYFRIVNYTWHNLQLNSLNISCHDYDLIISQNVIGSVESDAFQIVTATKLLFARNGGKNNGRFLFDADFSETPVIILDIRNNDGLELGTNVTFNDSTTHINLQENGITNIPAGIFKDLANLERLDLQGNRINCLESDSFYGLIAITNINISQNNLDYLLPATFLLGNLRELDLSDNNLRLISGDQFSFWEKNGSVYPEIHVDGNTISKLPHCLAQLDHFTYTGNPALELTGLPQANNTEPDGICNGTDPYVYEANTCEEWQTLAAADVPAIVASNRAAPTAEAPTAEASTPEAPTKETPDTGASTTEVSNTEVPTTKAPNTEVPTTKAPISAVLDSTKMMIMPASTKVSKISTTEKPEDEPKSFDFRYLAFIFVLVVLLAIFVSYIFFRKWKATKSREASAKEAKPDNLHQNNVESVKSDSADEKHEEEAPVTNEEDVETSEESTMSRSSAYVDSPEPPKYPGKPDDTTGADYPWTSKYIINPNWINGEPEPDQANTNLDFPWTSKYIINPNWRNGEPEPGPSTGSPINEETEPGPSTGSPIYSATKKSSIISRLQTMSPKISWATNSPNISRGYSPGVSRKSGTNKTTEKLGAKRSILKSTSQLYSSVASRKKGTTKNPKMKVSTISKASKKSATTHKSTKKT